MKEEEAAKAREEKALQKEEKKKHKSGGGGGKRGKGSEKVTASASDELDKKAIKKMKPKELKAHLKARGASIVGNKKELTARLLALI